MTPAQLYQQSLNKLVDLNDPQAASLLADALTTRTSFFLTFNQIDLISYQLTGDTVVAVAFAAALNTLRQSDAWWAAKWDTLAAGGVDVSLPLTQAKLDEFAVAQPTLAAAISAIKSLGVQRPVITDADVAAAKAYRDTFAQLQALLDMVNRGIERIDGLKASLAAGETIIVPTLQELLA